MKAFKHSFIPKIQTFIQKIYIKHHIRQWAATTRYHGLGALIYVTGKIQPEKIGARKFQKRGNCRVWVVR